MKKAMPAGRQGLTLVELLIAMTLASFVFLLVSTLLITVVNTNLKSKRQENFEQVKNDLLMEISNQVRWANLVGVAEVTNELVICNKEDLTVCDPGITNSEEIRYRFNTVDGSVEKNGEAITPNNVVITMFKIKSLSGIPGFASLKIDVEMRDRSITTNTDTLNIVVSQRKTRLEQNI